MEIQNMTKKICSKCEKIKPLSEFFRDKIQTSGFYPSCKDCYRKRLGMKKRPVGWGEWHKDSGGYIALNKTRLHRVILEKKIGRPLLRGEHVHHINGDKTDNRIENLELLDERQHHREHYLLMEIDPATGRIVGKNEQYSKMASGKMGEKTSNKM